jgi:hypothetical protein
MLVVVFAVPLAISLGSREIRRQQKNSQNACGHPFYCSHGSFPPWGWYFNFSFANGFSPFNRATLLSRASLGRWYSHPYGLRSGN